MSRRRDVDAVPPPAGPRLHRGFSAAWDVLSDAVKNFVGNGDTNQAAAIALYGILSLIPLFILSVLVINDLFGAHPEMQRALTKTLENIYASFSERVLDQLGQVDDKRRVLGWVGVLGLIWLSSLIFNAIETALNITFRSRVIRNYVTSKLLAFAMIPLGWAIIIASVGVSYAANIVARHPLLQEGFLMLPLFHGFFLRYLLPYLVTVAFSTLVYRITPTVRVSLGSALLGGAIFSALMEAAKHFFTWYIAGHTQYSIIYGPLEAVVVLMFWAFYAAILFLFCGELISSYERRNLLLLEKALLQPAANGHSRQERLYAHFGRLYPAGTLIYREGEEGRHLYYVLQGRVGLEGGTGDRLLGERGPGTYFGEVAALVDAPYSVSARTLEPTCLAAIDRETFHGLLRQNEEVSLFLLRDFARRLREMHVQFAGMHQSWLALVVLVCLLAGDKGRHEAPTVESLSQGTGKSPSDIRQVLAALQDQGVVLLQGRQIAAIREEKARAEACRLARVLLSPDPELTAIGPRRP